MKLIVSFSPKMETCIISSYFQIFLNYLDKLNFPTQKLNLKILRLSLVCFLSLL